MKKFNGKCESFSTAAEKIAKIVWGKDNRNYLEWRDKKNNLGNVHFLRISMRSRMREPYPGDPQASVSASDSAMIQLMHIVRTRRGAPCVNLKGYSAAPMQ